MIFWLFKYFFIDIELPAESTRSAFDIFPQKWIACF